MKKYTCVSDGPCLVLHAIFSHVTSSIVVSFVALILMLFSSDLSQKTSYKLVDLLAYWSLENNEDLITNSYKFFQMKFNNATLDFNIEDFKDMYQFL